MQLLGNLFEYELARRGETLNILGATSGDTGSAAEYAMRGKRGVRVFMLSPHGRMSPFQQAQMFSLQDANIHNIAIDGVFDDCQDIVKAVSQRPRRSSAQHRIGTVNSINWARVRGAGRVLLRRLLRRPRRRTTSRCQLRRAVRQLRQHLRRPRRAHDGPADRAGWSRHQRERRARRVLPHRHLPRAQRPPRRTRPRARRWTSRKASNFERFVFDLLRPRRRAHARAVRRAASSARRRLRRSTPPTRARASREFGFVSGTQHARRPRWRRSATPGSATATMIDTAHRRRPEGGARARASRACR